MKELFINFLNNKKIYCRYFSYMLKYFHSEDILNKYNTFFEDQDPCNWVDKAFYWFNTDEGAKFWTDINNEWLEVVKKESMQTYDVKITCAGTNAAELACIISKALDEKLEGKSKVCCK